MGTRLSALALLLALGCAAGPVIADPGDSLLGKDISVGANQDAGRIVDVTVDQGGRLSGAVIEFGGFLGIGVRKLWVPWSALRFTGGDGRTEVGVDLSHEAIRQLPEYRGPQGAR